MREQSAIRSTVLTLLVGALAMFFGCDRTSEGPASPADLVSPAAGLDAAPGQVVGNRTFWGPATRVGKGTARAFFRVDRNGAPVSVGVDFSAKALEKLPAEDASYVLRFHPEGAMPYTHVYLNWNAHGHEPPGIYDVPHFDFHFYVMPIEERLAIGPNDDAQFANAPDPQYIPADYLRIPGGVPQMGAHWIDLHAPEFNGQPFTRTFIWGTYDGEVIFVEPMITLAYLQSQPDETISLRQPEAFQKDGYYPMSYGVATHGGGGVRISLDGLAFHEGE